jgi:outer membrane protein TolC
MNFTVRQTLYAGGGIRAAMGSANLTRDAAILELKSVINEALLDVRTRFYSVLLARGEIKVQEQNLELLQSQLRNTTIRFEAGAISNFERLRAEVAVANAKPPLITARNDFRLAVEELRLALGSTASGLESLDKVPEFAGALTFEESKFELPAALDVARRDRPELQRLAKLIAAAEADEQSARAGYYPNLALTAGGELRKGTTDRFGDSLRGLRAGAQAQWTVNSRATTGQILQSVSLTEQARLAASASVLAVQVEVRRAFSSVEEANELVAATQKSVEQAEEAMRTASVRYETGMSLQLDLLKTQVELTTARTNQLRAFYQHNVALARLRKSMGLSDLEYVDGRARQLNAEQG